MSTDAQTPIDLESMKYGEIIDYAKNTLGIEVPASIRSKVDAIAFVKSQPITTPDRNINEVMQSSDPLTKLSLEELRDLAKERKIVFSEEDDEAKLVALISGGTVTKDIANTSGNDTNVTAVKTPVL